MAPLFPEESAQTTPLCLVMMCLTVAKPIPLLGNSLTQCNL